VKQVQDKNVEISLEEAKKIEEQAEIGSEIKVPIGFQEFGRNAIIAAKQILIQRVREAERDKIYEEYKNRIGEIVTGNVQQIEKGSLIVNLGKAEAVIPAKEQIQRERYRQGDRLRAYILDVQRTARGPQIILSRTNPGFLERLFELEVPEIFEKIIEIKAIAREPGERAKIAVSSIDDRVDPVGACVGVKGTRVQSVVRELNNERIDIVPWHPDPQLFVTRALAPAKIVRIDVFEEERTMTLVVENDMLSLAIGRGGQNARLAAKLTDWKINILGESEYKSTKKLDEGPKIVLSSLPGVGKKMEEKLAAAGIDSVQALVNKKVEELTKIEGIGGKKAEKLIELAKEYLTPKKIEGESKKA
jgi:N utilization substance protein A